MSLADTLKRLHDAADTKATGDRVMVMRADLQALLRDFHRVDTEMRNEHERAEFNYSCRRRAEEALRNLGYDASLYAP